MSTRSDCGIAPAFKTKILASRAVAQDVSGLVLRGPLPIGSGELGAWDQGGEELIVARDLAAVL